MKKFSIISLFSFCFLALSITSSQAQVIRRAATSSSLSAVSANSGVIQGVIYINKSSIPNTTNINQIAAIIKQDLKAFQFIPQNNGLLSDQYIHVNKTNAVVASNEVNVKSSGASYMIEYTIHKVPLMRPMMVKLTGQAAKSIRFAVEPQLKNFPVAYLTNCDRNFECYNFKGMFIPYIH